MQTHRSPSARPLVVVERCDEAGSAVARELHAAGYAVILTDDADPPWPRRGMSYVDAWYIGGATLAGIAACFCRSVRSIPAVLARADMIAATTWSWHAVASALNVVALVAPGDAAQAAALYGFAGVIAVLDAAHATHPCAIVAPRAGRFSTRFEIGERVNAGELLGEVGNDAIFAPASGVLRGLSARGARLAAGQRVAEIDVAGDVQRCYGIDPATRSLARRTVATVRRAMSIERAVTTSRQPTLA